MGWKSDIARDQKRMHPSYGTLSQSAPEGKVLMCKKCDHFIYAKDARTHVQTCWGIQLRPDEAVPTVTTKYALKLWIERRKKEDELRAVSDTQQQSVS